MLRVSLLGAEAITDDVTGTVGRPSSRALCLLALLVCRARTPQPRHLVAALFWPDSTEAQARTNLRRELHHLRRFIGDDDPSLVVTALDLCWNDEPSCRVDVRDFQAAREAVELADSGPAGDTDVLEHGPRALAAYGGELLPGQYDDWVLEARAELEGACVRICDRLVAAQRRARDTAGAVEVARRRLRLAPLAEAGHRQLMDVQADAGDRAAAISTYHRCVSLLERELGVSPSADTRDLFERLTVTPVSRSTGLRTASRRPPEYAASAPLVGRSPDLAVLADSWRRAVAAGPRLVLVSGVAGVGKTRLVKEMAARVRGRGAVVAIAGCFGSASRLALSPVADWLRNPAIDGALAGLEPVWRNEVGRLLESTSARSSDAIGPRAKIDAWRRSAFVEGLARALLCVSPRPLLLILEDAQWSDRETLEFLPQLLLTAGRAPLLVAVTLRRDAADPGPQTPDWAAPLGRAGLLDAVPLGPLDPGATGQLATTVLGRPVEGPEAREIQAVTGGFPLHIVEVGRIDLGAGRVADLKTLLRRRLAAASPTGREVAELAAAIGRAFPLELLVAASDLAPDEVVSAVDELWRRRILVDTADGYDFSHDLLRDAAYEQIGPPCRWLLHRRIAEALERLDSAGEPFAALLAEQQERGGQQERAVESYVHAGDLAATRFAHADAIHWHREALRVLEDLPAGVRREQQELGVLVAMAAPLNAQLGYGSRPLQEVLERSIELGERLGRRDDTVGALVGLWACRFVQGHTRESHAIAMRALAMVEPDSELAGQAHFGAGGSALSLGRLDDGLAGLEAAHRLAAGSASLSIGTRVDVHALAWTAHAHWLLGREQVAMDAADEAIRQARMIGHPYSLAVTLAYGAVTQQICGAMDELRETVGELTRLCERHEFAYYREWALVLAGWIRGGRSGIEIAQRGVARLRADGSLARMPYWLSLLADLYRRAGRADEALATLDAAIADARARDDVWWLPQLERERFANADPPTVS